MRETWRIHKKFPMSWLAGSRVKVTRATAIRLDERNQTGGDQNYQLGAILPKLELDMALVLVLVQDSSVALNNAAGSGPSQNRLAPSTPNSKYLSVH